MNQEILNDLMMQRSIHIPLYAIKNYKKLNLSLDEFVFLMYLKEKGKTFIFDPQIMCDDLGLELKKVMGLLANLTDKKILVVAASKNDKNVLEEYIDLSIFYEKYQMLLVDQIVESKQSQSAVNSDIYERIEKEFGRTLSPSEFEVIKAWLHNFQEDIILEAVKEAILNGVSSIRYIDKILYEWDKKKLKTKEDVEQFLHNRKKAMKEKEPVEVFDYDWFEEDEEE